MLFGVVWTTNDESQSKLEKKGPDLKGISKIGSNRLEDESNRAERRMPFSFLVWKPS